MPALRTADRHQVALAAPAAAGLAYVAAWIVGLAVFPSNMSVEDSGRDVVRTYGAHRAMGTAQFLLVEGVAAIALALVVIALARAAGHAGASAVAPTTLIAGLTACLISVAQCVLGVVLATSLASSAHVGRAGDVFDLINRLDGIKMLVLATFVASAGLAWRRLALPEWLRTTGWLTALALIVSGVGYVALDAALASAAFLSLPLLLVWVSATGLALGRASSI